MTKLNAIQSTSTDWVSYTPTVSSGTLSQARGRWRQNGDSMELQIFCAWSVAGSGGADLTVTIPSGFIIDLTKIARNDAGSTAQVVGNGYYFNGAAAQLSESGVNVASTTALSVFKNGTGVSYAQSEFVVNSQLNLTVKIPISNWSSNVTMADRAVEEYAYNTSTSTATDTTSFGNGPVGVALQAFAPAGTASVIKRTRLQTPRQATDRLVLEFRVNGSWVSSAEYLYGFGTNDAGTTLSGCIIVPVSGSLTDVDVLFYSVPFVGSTWAAEAAAGVFWRVRKVSGGAAVGYPVGARNVVGDTSGTAVPAGYIGERIDFSFLSPAMPAAAVVVNAWSATLQPGRWQIVGGVGVNCGSSGVVAGADNFVVVSVSTVSATEDVNRRNAGNLGPANSGGERGYSVTTVLDLTVATTVYVTVRHNYTTIGNSGISTTFAQRSFAVRIA